MNNLDLEALLKNNKIVTYHKIDAVNNLDKHFGLFKSEKVLVTVDDGDVSFYEIMFPLLKKYKLNAILFIITDLINTTNPFWWDEIKYYLGNDQGEKKVWEVKSWKNSERLNFLERLRSQSTKPRLHQKQLTSEQLLEMQNEGIIIANHSHTHPMLDKCDEVELKNEFRNSKLFFKNNNLNGYHILAYPNGNYDANVEKVAVQEGVKYAFLFDHKIAGKKFNPFRISRLSVTENTSITKLKFMLSGWHSKILPLRKTLHQFLKT